MLRKAYVVLPEWIFVSFFVLDDNTMGAEFAQFANVFLANLHEFLMERLFYPMLSPMTRMYLYRGERRAWFNKTPTLLFIYLSTCPSRKSL